MRNKRAAIKYYAILSNITLSVLKYSKEYYGAILNLPSAICLE